MQWSHGCEETAEVIFGWLFYVQDVHMRSLALPAGMQVLRICREQNSAMPPRYTAHPVHMRALAYMDPPRLQSILIDVRGKSLLSYIRPIYGKLIPGPDG